MWGYKCSDGDGGCMLGYCMRIYVFIGGDNG